MWHHLTSCSCTSPAEQACALRLSTTLEVLKWHCPFGTGSARSFLEWGLAETSIIVPSLSFETIIGVVCAQRLYLLREAMGFPC